MKVLESTYENEATKKAIQKTKFVKPSEPTIMRYIISYRVGQNQRNNNHQSQASSSNEPYYQTIAILEQTSDYQRLEKYAVARQKSVGATSSFKGF